VSGLSRRWRGDRASAAVEFALVLPLILVMVLALVQVGLLVKDQLVVSGSARAGGREAAVTLDDERVRQVAIDAAVGLNASELEVVIERQGGAGSPVRVSVRYHDAVAIPLVDWLFPDTIDLSSAVVFRQEMG
jgi:Flp pilus assembly protein TadG